MTKLNWDSTERPYYAGVDHGVLYLPGFAGVVWNGLVSVKEKADDVTINTAYLNGVRYALPQAPEDFSLSVSAYTYPDELLNFTGMTGIYDNQPIRSFNMSYRTGDSKTGQIHLVYNITAVPTDDDWKTLGGDVDPNLFGWEMTTRPVDYPYSAPSAHLIIDIAQTNPIVLQALYDKLYGTVSTNPDLPPITDIYNMFAAEATFKVADNGDGTWTATGPSDVIEMTSPTTFKITTLGAVFLSDVMYRLSSF